MIKKFSLLFFSICLCLSMTGCTKDNTVTDSTDKTFVASSYSIDKRKLNIPNLSRSYKILFINDTHIIVPNDEISEDSLATVTERANSLFVTQDGVSSADNWLQLTKELDSENADAIIFNGDIQDYYSSANQACLEKGMNMVKTPSLYIKSNHDIETLYTKENPEAKEEANVLSMEFDDFLIVGINMSYRQLTPQGLTQLKTLFSMGKPIILVTHVPLNSKTEPDYFASAIPIKRPGEERLIVWGDGCYFSPNEITTQYLDMVYTADSPVVAVIGAHLHFPVNIMLTETIPEYVFDATYKGSIGELDITSK